MEKLINRICIISFSLDITPSTPMSFEDAFQMGQTGRTFPSTSNTGRKSTIVSRKYDLDEEDWC